MSSMFPFGEIADRLKQRAFVFTNIMSSMFEILNTVFFLFAGSSVTSHGSSSQVCAKEEGCRVPESASADEESEHQAREAGDQARERRRGKRPVSKSEVCSAQNFSSPSKRLRCLSAGGRSPFKTLSPYEKRNPRSCSVKCMDCGQAFQNYKERQQHVATVHKNQYHCTVCGKKFSSKKGRNQHEPLHETNYCRSCHKRFDTPEELTKHKATVHKASHQCPKCDSSFTRRNDLKRHDFAQHQPKWNCPMCCQDVPHPVEKHMKKFHPAVHEKMQTEPLAVPLDQ